MKDRGATCCVFEASHETVLSRRTDWVEVGVVVHTSLAPLSATRARSDGAASSGGGGTYIGAQGEARQAQQAAAATNATLQLFEKLMDPSAQVCEGEGGGRL